MLLLFPTGGADAALAPAIIACASNLPNLGISRKHKP